MIVFLSCSRFDVFIDNYSAILLMHLQSSLPRFLSNVRPITVVGCYSKKIPKSGLDSITINFID